MLRFLIVDFCFDGCITMSCIWTVAAHSDIQYKYIHVRGPRMIILTHNSTGLYNYENIPDDCRRWSSTDHAWMQTHGHSHRIAGTQDRTPLASHSTGTQLPLRPIPSGLDNAYLPDCGLRVGDHWPWDKMLCRHGRNEPATGCGSVEFCVSDDNTNERAWDI